MAKALRIDDIHSPPDQIPPKVLVVDDRPENLYAVENILKTSQAQVIKAQSGVEALSLSFHHDFALILMDVQMPEMNGYETATLLREKAKTHQTPIIFLAGTQEDGRASFKKNPTDVVDYIFKPVDSDILQSKVKFFLDLHNTTQHLKKSEEQLQNIIQFSPDGMIVVDHNRIMQYVNPSAERLFNITSEKMVGNFFAYPVTDHQKMEISLPRVNQPPIHAEMWLNDIQWQGENAWLATFRDITERIKKEQILQQSRDAALETSRFKSEFLANMSHEIRTPMNAIIGMADVLNETSLTPEQRKYVDIFQKAGVNLLNVINNILDLSKLEAEEIPLEEIDLNVESLLEGVQDLLHQKAKEKGLHIVCDISPHIPKNFLGDPHRLQQVLINLVGNAIKFTDKGDICLKAETREKEILQGQCLVRFSVKDSGVGIPKDKISSIFTPFKQTDSSISRKFGGTGLGLAISKKLVNRMGGMLEVFSQEGEGATFHFTIPLKLQDKPAPLSPEEKTKPDTAHAAASGCRPLRILLADDSQDSQYLIQAYLKKTGHLLESAENGEEAVRMAKSDRFDLILMDMQMPLMDGYTAVKSIRKWETSKNRSPVPIIALTAYALSNEMQKSLDAGCTSHLSKPIKKQNFLDMLKNYTQNLGPSAVFGRKGDDPEKTIVNIEPEIRPLIPRFLDNRKKDLLIIQGALDKRDFGTIQGLSHNMKGVGVSYGFEFLSYAAAFLEQAAKDEDYEEVEKRMKELISYFANIQINYE